MSKQAELPLEGKAPPEPEVMTVEEWSRRVAQFMPDRAVMRAVTLNLPDDMWKKLKAIARFRDMPMSHVVAVASKPLVDKLYAEMENDYRAAMRGEKRER
jgi:hypothetical protein